MPQDLSRFTITQDADNALASALSAAVYTDNVWMLQTLSSPAESIPDWRVAAMPESDPLQIERACLLKRAYKKFEGVDLPVDFAMQDPIGGGRIDCSYKDGVYFAGDLACAAVVERRLPGSKSVVELSFRGTEKETTGDPKRDRGNLIGGYFLSAYQDLRGHYERHRPLIDQVVREVSRRQAAGEDVELVVSGHSLGGSMAEIFADVDAPKLRDPGKSMAITFGSPGKPKDYEPMSRFGQLVGGMARLIKAQLGFGDIDARKVARRGAGQPAAKGPDSCKVVQYVDPNDPIPKVGLLGGLKPSGSVSYSRWSFDREMKRGRPIKGGFLDVSWHSALLYEKAMGFLLDWRAGREPGAGTPRADLSAWSGAKFDAAGVMARAEANPIKPVSAATARALGDEAMVSSAAPNRLADENKRAAAVEAINELVPLKLKSWIADRKARAEARELEGVGPAEARAPGLG